MKASTILALLLLSLVKFITGQSNKRILYEVKSDSELCITRKSLLEYSQLDTVLQLVKKPAILNLISAIKACGYGYHYDTGFQDKACRLVLPNWLDDYSLNFGDSDFFISFDDHESRTGNCIVLYYNLQKEEPRFFLKQMRKPWQPSDSLIKNGKTIYRFKTDRGMQAGEILLDNTMSVAYYTCSPEMEIQFQDCILSCRLE